MLKRLDLESLYMLFKNGKYLASIKYDSAVMCDEVIESWNQEAKFISTNFYEKIQPVKSIIASC